MQRRRRNREIRTLLPSPPPRRIPQILRRAFYEVVANKDFWDVHNAGSVKVDLPKDDLDRLLGMRLYLDLQWPKYMTAAPCIDDGQAHARWDGPTVRL